MNVASAFGNARALDSIATNLLVPGCAYKRRNVAPTVASAAAANTMSRASTAGSGP
ncbi:Uncharacterised protein [Mycobacteroides abscessus subsp. abscessus]|nr:Uncharacterised protein [Mycobacteroides abscessus subsp. abscessus]